MTVQLPWYTAVLVFQDQLLFVLPKWWHILIFLFHEHSESAFRVGSLFATNTPTAATFVPEDLMLLSSRICDLCKNLFVLYDDICLRWHYLKVWALKMGRITAAKTRRAREAGTRMADSGSWDCIHEHALYPVVRPPSSTTSCISNELTITCWNYLHANAV